MSRNEASEGRAYFALLLGVPALLAWLAYGFAWLIGPHLAVEPSPLLWAGYAAGGYYLMIAFVVGGPLVLLGL